MIDVHKSCHRPNEKRNSANFIDLLQKAKFEIYEQTVLQCPINRFHSVSHAKFIQEFPAIKLANVA
jgi:hypothetical protein